MKFSDWVPLDVHPDHHFPSLLITEVQKVSYERVLMFIDSICTITWLHLDSVLSNPLGKKGILDIDSRKELIQVPIYLVRDLKG